MSWIKRNLSLVISGILALGLLGFGGYYLWSAMKKNAEIDNQINQAKSEIDRLLNMEPTPTPSNLNSAKRELEKLQTFIAQAKRQFPPTPPPAVPLNNESFKNMLERTIDELHKEAGSANVKLDSNYYFSFAAQRDSVLFPPESLRPLSERLQEVQTIASILFKARINNLESIQRAGVAGEKISGTDYLNRAARTNAETRMVLWPYEVTFQCFTSELAAVLEALERAQYGFIVRFPLIAPAVEEKAPPPPNLRNPPGRQTNVQPSTLTTIINEKLLRVTLRLEVIKPEPFQTGGPGRRGGPGGGP